MYSLGHLYEFHTRRNQDSQVNILYEMKRQEKRQPSAIFAAEKIKVLHPLFTSLAY